MVGVCEHGKEPAGKVLTSWTTIRFSRRTVFGVSLEMQVWTLRLYYPNWSFTLYALALFKDIYERSWTLHSFSHCNAVFG